MAKFMIVMGMAICQQTLKFIVLGFYPQVQVQVQVQERGEGK
jgi:hypothetical protein